MSNLRPIKAWRKLQNLSQEAAGKRVGVTRFTWMRWENGSPIDVELIPTVARETQIPAKELRPDLAELIGAA
jgi:transcriptional regulator with XRE-family HTH domain